MNRYVLLSFDVEEFDMPLEYGFPISVDEQMQVGKKGMDAITPVLDDPSITSTLFTTANFALRYPDAIRALANRHEIASHTFYHSSFEEADLLRSKDTLENISAKKVTGLRMPRMRTVSLTEVKKAGYEYDSSVNPTWLPGRYNNLHLPRIPYRQEEVLRIPASVSPGLRIPLFWLSFKNLPYYWFRQLALQTLKKDGYICLYFHPWEFTGIDGYGLPRYTRKPDDGKLLSRLQQLIADLKTEADFISMRDYATICPFV